MVYAASKLNSESDQCKLRQISPQSLVRPAWRISIQSDILSTNQARVLGCGQVVRHQFLVLAFGVKYASGMLQESLSGFTLV